MLIISRKTDQKIIVADNIEITILQIGRNRVRFGIKAPKNIPIQTRLKTSPNEQGPYNPIEVERKTLPFEGLPASAGINKRR